MAFCNECGSPLIKGATYCSECGTKVSGTDGIAGGQTYGIPKKKCPVCGEEMPEDMFYCLNCGSQFSTEQEENLDDVVRRVQKLEGTWKNKWVAFMLCLILGWCGAHRFYEGKTGFGILYLFTFGLFGLGWAVDIIRLALKPNPYRVR